MDSVATVNKREKCPYCNKAMDVTDYKPGIKNIRLSRSEKTMNAIDDVVNIINEAMPTNIIDESKYYMLLKETSDIMGIVLRKALHKFKEKNHADRGHGVHYLISMIKGENSSHVLREKYENDTLDRLPPVKERDD